MSFENILRVQNAEIYRAILRQYGSELGQFPTPVLGLERINLSHDMTAGGFLNPSLNYWQVSAAIDISSGSVQVAIPEDTDADSFGDAQGTVNDNRRHFFRIRFNSTTAPVIEVSLDLGRSSSYVAYATYELSADKVLNLEVLVPAGFQFWVTLLNGSTGDNVFVSGFTLYAPAGVEVPK